MNKVFLVGRFASDPQQFVTTNGINQSRITIACNDSWNKNESYFFPCVAWQSTANFINTYLKKGDLVAVDGKLIRRSFVSKEGRNIHQIEIVIETIRPLGSKNAQKNTNLNSDLSKSATGGLEINPTFYNKDNVNKNDINSFDQFDEDLKQLDEINNKSIQNSNDDEIVDLDWMSEYE